MPSTQPSGAGLALEESERDLGQRILSMLAAANNASNGNGNQSQPLAGTSSIPLSTSHLPLGGTLDFSNSFTRSLTLDMLRGLTAPVRAESREEDCLRQFSILCSAPVSDQTLTLADPLADVVHNFEITAAPADQWPDAEKWGDASAGRDWTSKWDPSARGRSQHADGQLKESELKEFYRVSLAWTDPAEPNAGFIIKYEVEVTLTVADHLVPVCIPSSFCLLAPSIRVFLSVYTFLLYFLLCIAVIFFPIFSHLSIFYRFSVCSSFILIHIFYFL